MHVGFTVLMSPNRTKELSTVVHMHVGFGQLVELSTGGLFF